MKNKRTILEIILIPLCISYILYYILNNNQKASYVISIFFLILTALIFIVKYINEVYIYENKNNKLKVLFIIFNIILLITTMLSIALNNKIINIIFIILLICLLLYLLCYAINNIIKIIKENKKSVSQYIIRSFFSLTSFIIILTTYIISIIK